MDFKERIFQARKAKGFSQEDLAELVGVSRQAVSKWETGEAMPDTEKLIALCSALDLDMEYLALGKTPAAPASSPKKTLLWLGASLLAIVFFGAGFLSGYWAAPQPTPEVSSQPDTPPYQQYVVIGSQQQESVTGPISDFNIKPIGKSKLELFILPAVLTEGMEVRVLCEDRIRSKTQTHTCSFDGTFYRLQLPRTNNYHYYITAVLERDGVKEQLPLAEISGDGSGWSTHHLWKG